MRVQPAFETITSTRPMVLTVSLTRASTHGLVETSAWMIWKRGVDGFECVIGILESSSTSSEAREVLEA
jgi:hypothetical protein